MAASSLNSSTVTGGGFSPYSGRQFVRQQYRLDSKRWSFTMMETPFSLLASLTRYSLSSSSVTFPSARMSTFSCSSAIVSISGTNEYIRARIKSNMKVKSKVSPLSIPHARKREKVPAFRPCTACANFVVFLGHGMDRRTLRSSCRCFLYLMGGTDGSGGSVHLFLLSQTQQSAHRPHLWTIWSSCKEDFM